MLNGSGFTIEYSPVPLQFFNISRNYLENQSQGYWKKKREITEEKENNPVRVETTSTGYFRFFLVLNKLIKKVKPTRGIIGISLAECCELFPQFEPIWQTGR